MKRLLIDVNSIVPYYVSGKVNGIGRTTLELLQALANIEEMPFEIMLYSQNFKGIGGEKTGFPFKSKHLYMRNNANWNKIIAKYPIRECLTKYNLMHIPHNFEYVYRPEKCIVTLHDALFMKMQEQAFDHEKMRLIVPPFIQRCKHVITCSDSSKRDIVETMGIPEDKVSVIYWGIKHDVFKPMMSDNQFHHPYFLSVSCNAERKRTDLLIKAYIDFCKHFSDKYDLVLVWGNPPQHLLEEISHSQVANKIHFLKNISDEELANLYNNATAMFFPSSYEGFGLPVIEAMACGTPVVTCRNSSLGEIAGNAAIFLDEPIEKNLIEVMKNFSDKKYETIKIREDGIKHASSFTWEKCAQQTIEVYKSCLNL